MFVYRYELNPSTPTITVRTIECAEKPKTYQPIDKWVSRINKSDIGVVGSRWKYQVNILEKDFEKAKELLVNKYKHDIGDKKHRIESIQGEINTMEKHLVDINRLIEKEGE